MTEVQRTHAADDNGIPPLFAYLGSRVRYAVGNVSDEAPNIPVLYQSSDPFRNVIQKPHGVAEEVHRPQDPRRLAEELLSQGGGGQEEQPVYTADSVPAPRVTSALCSVPINTTNRLSVLTTQSSCPFPGPTSTSPQCTHPGAASNSHTFPLKDSSKPFRRLKKV